MSYNSERRAFAHLKDNCPQAVSDEYVQAIKTVLERYNTTIYENRFVTGGAVEIFTCALLRSVGLDCTLYLAVNFSLAFRRKIQYAFSIFVDLEGHPSPAIRIKPSKYDFILPYAKAIKQELQENKTCFQWEWRKFPPPNLVTP